MYIYAIPGMVGIVTMICHTRYGRLLGLITMVSHLAVTHLKAALVWIRLSMAWPRSVCSSFDFPSPWSVPSRSLTFERQPNAVASSNKNPPIRCRRARKHKRHRESLWRKKAGGAWVGRASQRNSGRETHGLGFTQTFLNQLSSGIFKSGLIYGSCTMSATGTPRWDLPI